MQLNAPSPTLLTIVDVATVAVAAIAVYVVWLLRRPRSSGVPRHASGVIAAGLSLSGLFALASLGAAAFLREGTSPIWLRSPGTHATVWVLTLVSVAAGLAMILVHARRLDAEARLNERRLRAILANLHDAYIRADRDGIIRQASEAAAEILLGGPGTIVGERSDSFYRSPEDRENLLRMVREAGGTLQLEGIRMRRRDGKVLHVSFTARLIDDGSDCDGGLESFVRDVTGEYEALEARRRSEARFRDFAEMASDWLWETDGEYRMVWVSGAFEERTGRQVDDVIGRPLWETFGDNYHHEIPLDDLRRWMKAEQAIEDLRYSVRYPDGRVMWRRLNARPRYNREGAFLGYRGATSDITAAVQAESRFRELIEASPEMIVVFRDGRIVYLNPAAIAGFGGNSAADFVDLETVSLAHPDDRDIVRERRRMLIAGEPVPDNHPVHLQRLDGSDFYGESTIASISWEGSPAIMMSIRDITARRLAEQRVRESEERFRDFAELSSDWLYETDENHVLVWLSDSFRGNSPVAVEEVLGTRFWDDKFGTLRGSGDMQEQKRLMEAHEPYRDFVYSIEVDGGEAFWRRTSARPCFDADGRFTGHRGSTTDITDRVSTERSFRSLIESMPDAIFIQRDDIIVYTNPAMPRIFGATSNEAFIGRDSLTLYHPDEHETIRERRAALRRGESVPVMDRQRLLRPDGTGFYGEAAATMIVWEGAPALMVMLRDISERVAADEAREASEEQYRQLAELLPEAYVVQCEGRIVYANETGRRLFGRPDEDIVGRDGTTLVAPERRDWVLARRNRVMETGIAEGPDRGRHVRGDGTVFESESIAGPFHWNGRPATINLIADISDRIAAEKSLAENEKRFRDFAQSTSDWFWEIGPDYRFTWFSTSTHPISGVPVEQIVGVLPWDLAGVTVADSAAWTRYVEHLNEHLPFRDLTVESRRLDGTIAYLSVSGTPLFEDDGTFAGFRGSKTDVTAQMDLEGRLRQAQKMEAIGQLTGGIAHDFNNLLAIISGNLELLAEQDDGEGGSTELIRPALRAADRGADLTKYLLAFSRQQPLSPRPVDINRLISGMTDPLRRALGARVELETMVATGGWLALVDPAQTENAVLNLALNARDAMPTGGKLTIEAANATLDDEYSDQFEDVAPGRYVMVSVSDQGVGIAPEMLDRVFDPFVTTKGVGQGSGLGLSMVYGFVKQSGGHVRIYSEVGKGTTVRMYLPEAGAGATEAEPPRPQETVPEGAGETVLVVEDDTDVLNLVNVLLTNLNYRVVTAADAPAALGVLDGGTAPDLLLTDVILPGGTTGVELSRQIADRLSGIPVIFMSGYTENSIIHQGVLDDGVMLLSKPFKKLDLATLVRRALSEHGEQVDG